MQVSHSGSLHTWYQVRMYPALEESRAKIEKRSHKSHDFRLTWRLAMVQARRNIGTIAKLRRTRVNVGLTIAQKATNFNRNARNIIY